MIGRAQVVFFGRLELKKGLVLFCDTLDQLSRNPQAMEVCRVTVGHPVSQFDVPRALRNSLTKLAAN